MQNDADIGAERALSSFNQTHVLRLNYMFQSPIKANRQGFIGNAFRGWTIGGVLTATSGTPFTATVPGDPSGTGFTGTARAEATGLPVNGTRLLQSGGIRNPRIGNLWRCGP